MSENKILVELTDVSEWEIFIDDGCGELGMQKIEHLTGRKIDVLAKEEIMPLYENLQSQLEAKTKEVTVLIKSLNRIGEDCANGEHVDQEWVNEIIKESAGSFFS